MSSVKQDVESVLRKLPDDCSLEDVQYELYVIQKVKQGLDQVDAGDHLSHEQITKRLDRWTTK